MRRGWWRLTWAKNWPWWICICTNYYVQISRCQRSLGIFSFEVPMKESVLFFKLFSGSLSFMFASLVSLKKQTPWWTPPHELEHGMQHPLPPPAPSSPFTFHRQWLMLRRSRLISVSNCAGCWSWGHSLCACTWVSKVRFHIGANCKLVFCWKMFFSNTLPPFHLNRRCREEIHRWLDRRWCRT